MEHVDWKLDVVSREYTYKSGHKSGDVIIIEFPPVLNGT